MNTIEWFAQMLFLILIISVSSLKWYQSSHILPQMTEHDLFKEILSDVAYTKISRVSILVISLIMSFNMTTVIVKHMPLPWPSFPEANNESWLVVVSSMHPPQLWFLWHEDCPYLLAVSFTDSRRCLEPCLNTLLLRYHRRKNHTGLGQGVLVAILGHKSTQLPCGWRVLSVFLLQLCVDEQVHHPVFTINASKLHAVAVRSARVSESQFPYLSSGDTAHHWDCCVQLSKTEPSSLIVWRNFSILSPKLVLEYAEDILSDSGLKNCAKCKGGWCKPVCVERFEIWVKKGFLG